VDSLLSAGETLHVRGGVYTDTTDKFTSAASGTAVNRITIQAWQTETYGPPIFRTMSTGGTYDGVFNIQNAYWVIDGIELRPTGTNKTGYGIYANGNGDYIEIKNCAVIGVNDSWSFTWVQSAICIFGDYSYVHDNEVEGVGICDVDGYTGYGISVFGRYSRISNNTLSKGCHDNISIYGSGSAGINNEVIANNVSYGIGYLSSIEADETLVERNIGTGMNQGPVNHQKSPILIYGSSHDVIRYNVGHHCSQDFYGGSDNGSYGCDQYTGESNRWYNNIFWYNDQAGLHFWNNNITIYHKFYNNVWAKNSQHYGDDWDAGEVTLHYPDSLGESEFKNNFFMGYSSGWQDGGAIINANEMVTVASVESSYPSAWSQNIHNSTGCSGLDPKFVDPDTDPDAPDFTLQSSSCLINAGRWLTTATSASSGSSIAVADARFFWYSYWATEWNSKFGTSYGVGDKIAVITNSGIETAKITGISYGTEPAGTLSLDTSLSAWSNGAAVTLYASFNDYDTILLVGSNPDIGAYEYTSGEPPTPATMTGIYRTGVTSN